MNKKLFAELAKLEDHEFFCMEHYFNFARMIRDTISKNGLTNKFIAGILGVPEKHMKAILNAAYDIDLRMLSKLQSYMQDVAYNNAKLKIEAESIGFTTYKDQYPLYVSKIEKLIAILEKQKPQP